MYRHVLLDEHHPELQDPDWVALVSRNERSHFQWVVMYGRCNQG